MGSVERAAAKHRALAQRDRATEPNGEGTRNGTRGVRTARWRERLLLDEMGVIQYAIAMKKRMILWPFLVCILVFGLVWLCDNGKPHLEFAKALPANAGAVAYVEDLREQYEAFFRHPIVRAECETLQIDPDDALASGWKWLFRLVSGPRSYFAAGYETDRRPYLAAVSEVTWRTPILRFFQTIKRIPGVIRFEESESGVLFLRFAPDDDYVLSIRVVGRHLLAYWGPEGDFILEMEKRFRAKEAAACETLRLMEKLFQEDGCEDKLRVACKPDVFAEGEEWADVLRQTDLGNRLLRGNWVVLLSDLEDETLSARVVYEDERQDGEAISFGDGLSRLEPEALSIPVDSLLAFVAGDTKILSDWLRRSIGLPIEQTGPSALWISDSAHGGSLFGFPMPALCGVAPSVKASKLERWFARASTDAYWKSDENRLAALGARPKLQSGNTLLLRFPKQEFLGSIPKDKGWFVAAEEQRLYFGTAYGSWQGLRLKDDADNRQTIASVLSARSKEPEAALYGWADGVKLADWLRYVKAFLQLGSRLGMVEKHVVQAYSENLEVAGSIIRPLGAVSFAAGSGESNVWVRLHFSGAKADASPNGEE